MRRTVLFMMVLMFIGVISTSYSYAQSDSIKVLKQAAIDFEEGKLKEVIFKLEPLLAKKGPKNSLTKNEKWRACRLVGLSYFYLGQADKADPYVKKLLILNPYYKSDPIEDSSPFTDRVNYYKVWPKFTIGLQSGILSSKVKVLKEYSIGVTETRQGAYSRIFGGFIGPEFSYYPIRYLSVSVSMYFGKKTLRYDELNTFDFTRITYNEYFSTFDLPISLKYEIRANGNSNVWPHVRIGTQLTRMMNVKGVVQRDYQGSFSQNRESLETARVNITDQRRKYEVSLLFGAGANVKIREGFLSLEVRVRPGILNLVDPEQRYSNDPLVTEGFYVSDDFKINNLEFVIGYSYQFNRVKPAHKNLVNNFFNRHDK